MQNKIEINGFSTKNLSLTENDIEASVGNIFKKSWRDGNWFVLEYGDENTIKFSRYGIMEIKELFSDISIDDKILEMLHILKEISKKLVKHNLVYNVFIRQNKLLIDRQLITSINNDNNIEEITVKCDNNINAKIQKMEGGYWILIEGIQDPSDIVKTYNLLISQYFN